MAALNPATIDGLAPESRELMAALAGRPWAVDFYLAGSAALALHAGHREVRDLDLMSQFQRLVPAGRRDLLQDLLALDGATRVETARDGFLYVRTGAGVGLRFYYYPYPLVEPVSESGGLAVASAVDLGLMKLAAIISRGTRRDFVDLYLLADVVPLDELLERSAEKFGHVRDFPLQALKGLADQSLVEGEPMPALAEPLEWTDVAVWIGEQVRTLGRRQVGLEAK